MRNAYVNIPVEELTSDASITNKDNTSFSKTDASSISAPKNIREASGYMSAMQKVVKAIIEKNMIRCALSSVMMDGRFIHK